MRPGQEKNAIALDHPGEVALAAQFGVVTVSAEDLVDGIVRLPYELSNEQTDELIGALIARSEFDMASQVRGLSWEGGGRFGRVMKYMASAATLTIDGMREDDVAV